jgi:Dolichyl-phosphate-mannose-protein mannosyltransferase
MEFAVLALVRPKGSPELVVAPETRRPWPYWLAPALLMLGLGLWRVEQPELWRDELFTWSAVARPLPDLARMLGTIDAVLGPYYLLMHAWTAVAGTGVVALRLPSVLAMAVTAGVVARIGGELVSPRAGVLAGFVLCATPAVSRTAQEARPYALATLAAATATLLLVRALRAPSTKIWIGYGLALVATGYLHLFAFTVLLGHAVAVAGLTRFRARGWLFAAGGACLAVAPVAVVGLTQRAQVAYLRLTQAELLFTYPEALIGAAVVAGLALALAVTGGARYPKTAWIAGGLALAPVAALVAVGAVAHVFAVRYLFFTLVGWAVVVGAGLAASARPARWLSLALVAVLGVPAHQAIREASGHADHGARTAVRDLLRQQLPGDGIAYEDVSWLRVAMDYHLPDAGRPRDVLMTRSAAAAGGFIASECAQPATCVAGVPRLWVVHQHPERPLRTMKPAKAAAIRDRYEPATSYRHGSVTLTVYMRRG